MKQVDIKSIVIPNKPRSGNYPVGSTVVRGGSSSGGSYHDLSLYLLKNIWERNIEERKEENGNEYLLFKKSIVSESGITAFALGDRTPSTILDGLIIDETTLSKEGGKLSVIGGVGGASNWDELEGKPDWIGATKPTYNWSEILAKPTTLAGYGIADAYTKTESDGKYLLKTSYTATDVLAKLKSVDGSGSGLDADTLDTKHYYDFLYNFGYNITSASNIRDIPHGTFFSSNSAQNGPVQYIWFNGIVFASNNNSNYKKIFGVDDSGVFWVANENNGTWNDWKRVAYTTDTVASALKLTTDAGSNVNPVYFANGVPVRCAYSFGNGSGNAAVSNGILCTNLNADTLDGVHNGFVSGNLQSYSLPYTNTDKVGWWVKIASMSLNYRYTSKEAVLLISKTYTITGNSQYAFIFARIQQQNAMGGIPNTELSSFGSIDNSNIVGILNYNGSVSTLDIYFREVEQYQRGLVSLVQGNEIRTNSQDFVQSLPAGGQIVSVNSFVSGHSKRLLTARTLWGRPFDGTANVDGDIVNTQRVKSKDGIYLDLYGNNGIAFYTANSIRGVILNSGYFGIGTTSPSTNLHVVGNALVTGGMTCYQSDARAKTILEELNLSLKDIAESPTIRFKWNNWKIKDDGKTHIGGIAQYVQKILPETILEADGVLNLDYATTAYIYSVQTARHLNTYETRTDRKIKKLEKEIKILKRKLKQLGYEDAKIS